jgi:hypothetical protein
MWIIRDRHDVCKNINQIIKKQTKSELSGYWLLAELTYLWVSLKTRSYEK